MTNPYIGITGSDSSALPNMSLVPAGFFSQPIKSAPTKNFLTPTIESSSVISPSNATELAMYYGETGLRDTSLGDGAIEKANYFKASPPPKKTVDGGGIDGGGAARTSSKYSAEQIKNFASGTINVMKGINSVYNGYITNLQYDMKAANKDFVAEQNERAADLLRQNIRDINRAAQADANVYRLEGVKTKSAQRVAQAASGFAVGKGTYKTMLDTTEARTNYNTSMLMLKAGLQNAEVLRQAGTLEAQAILDRFDAHALREQGEMERNQGWVDGIMSVIEGGVDFYVGKYGFDDSKKGKV